jgi:hypothetical protein
MRHLLNSHLYNPRRLSISNGQVQAHHSSFNTAPDTPFNNRYFLVLYVLIETNIYTAMPCCLFNCFGICRNRRRSPGFGPPTGNDPIELQYIAPPAPVALPRPSSVVRPNNPVFTSSLPGSIPTDNPNDYQYGEREMWGGLRQRWIDDANEPNCTVKPLDFEFRV